MNQLKSSTALKAQAREQLLGNYKTAILAYIIMQLLVSGCLTLVEMQGNLQSSAGILLYYAVYFIVMLLSSVLNAGQNCLYLNIARGNKCETGNLWYGFHTCADRCIFVYLLKLGKCILYGIPLLISACLLIITQNYYLSLSVAACLIFFMIGCVIVYLDYSQALYLVLDYPQESPTQLLAHSKALMKGHRGSLFYLLVSFLGMYTLGFVTCGLGMLWVYPYVSATRTNYYLELLPQESREE